jgi:hypothetical protein
VNEAETQGKENEKAVELTNFPKCSKVEEQKQMLE